MRHTAVSKGQPTCMLRNGSSSVCCMLYISMLVDNAKDSNHRYDDAQTCENRSMCIFAAGPEPEAFACQMTQQSLSRAGRATV